MQETRSSMNTFFWIGVVVIIIAAIVIVGLRAYRGEEWASEQQRMRDQVANLQENTAPFSLGERERVIRNIGITPPTTEERSASLAERTEFIKEYLDSGLTQ